MWITDTVQLAVEQAASVFYVNQLSARAWNSLRAIGDPVVFTGWHWAKDGREAGPFKSKSSCYRDAWYVLVARTSPPSMEDCLVHEVFDTKKRKPAKAKLFAGDNKVVSLKEVMSHRKPKVRATALKDRRKKG